MSINYAERHQLHRIESRLFRSDPHLAAMLAVFDKLCDGQCLPAQEQLATRQGRIRHSAALVAQAIAAVIAAILNLLRAVDAWLTAVTRRSLGLPPRPRPTRQQAGPGTGGRPDPASRT
jgi:Protein of unknown function (DUF3040)